MLHCLTFWLLHAVESGVELQSGYFIREKTKVLGGTESLTEYVCDRR